MINNRNSPRFTSRILIDEKDKQAFALGFTSVGGNFQIPDEYLHRASARGFFKNNEMVAGYLINDSAPFRYEMILPEEARIDLQKRGYLVEATSCELTCMWMRKGTLTSFERNAVYVRSTVDTFRTQKRYVIAGSVVEALARMQKQTLPRTIYHGLLAKGGMVEIYVAPRYLMMIRITVVALIAYPRDLLHLLKNSIINFFDLRDPLLK
ncbi:hypothetical protein FAM09_16045 [Niastella caeni]|uniref:Uncharacterized protein n=1 Tax=Niastella caeni TaxID=2569763 RepID=A0A4S8HT50_9BACT|nr:hypothetical protein [Niastella caeni]THU38191.1 hypothetical protein FAM09_16045 [Niastella caeni]